MFTFYYVVLINVVFLIIIRDHIAFHVNGKIMIIFFYQFSIILPPFIFFVESFPFYLTSGRILHLLFLINILLILLNIRSHLALTVSYQYSYTTQTCSFCGSMYKPGLSRVYHCRNCEKSIGRDVNAAKNILMKGIQVCLY